jgi:hypothetical protein
MTPDVRNQLARALAGQQDPLAGDMLGPYQPMTPGRPPLSPQGTPPMGMPQAPQLDQQQFQEWLKKPDNADWYQRIIRPGS